MAQYCFYHHTSPQHVIWPLNGGCLYAFIDTFISTEPTFPEYDDNLALHIIWGSLTIELRHQTHPNKGVSHAEDDNNLAGGGGLNNTLFLRPVERQNISKSIRSHTRPSHCLQTNSYRLVSFRFLYFLLRLFWHHHPTWTSDCWAHVIFT